MAERDDQDASIEAAAARWMARRDRGMSPAEQDQYLQWLSEDREHGAEIHRLSRSWERLDALKGWHPAHSTQPNPDLLRPTRRTAWFRPALAFAAAACLVAALGFHLLPSPTAPAAPADLIVHPGPRFLDLSDGSRVELRHDAEVEVHFSPERRDLRLLTGEAHFNVAHDSDRPFVVTANAWTARAVGTAFDVSLAEAGIQVLVTEGIVQLDRVDTDARDTPLARLAAGQQARVTTAGEVEVQDLTPGELDAARDWRSIRLEFAELPLRVIVAEFNRFNARRLRIDDDTIADMQIGGTFRADNLDAFVRLLDVGFGVTAEAEGDDLVLRRRR